MSDAGFIEYFTATDTYSSEIILQIPSNRNIAYSKYLKLYLIDSVSTFHKFIRHQKQEVEEQNCIELNEFLFHKLFGTKFNRKLRLLTLFQYIFFSITRCNQIRVTSYAYCSNVNFFAIICNVIQLTCIIIDIIFPLRSSYVIIAAQK